MPKSKTKLWNDAQYWEKSWWGDCLNTFNEEEKQYIYARYMGLNKYAFNKFGQRGWNFENLSVLDVGCGPVSMLLKSKATLKIGIDPCIYPDWVNRRYVAAKIGVRKEPAESVVFDPGSFDIGLIYNCLQHVIDPEVILANMRIACKVIHVFEWVDNGISEGHLHNLTEDNLNYWLGGEGHVTFLEEKGCVGKAYHGIFKGDYE